MKLKLALFIYIFRLLNPLSLKAKVNVVSSSAYTPAHKSSEFDYRKVVLKKYLYDKSSPIAEYANDFVDFADLNDLDWRLVAAISGIESSFGKRIPRDSFNAYGWANGNYYFESWPHSINHVSSVIKNKYYDKGLNTIKKISKVYAPPSSTWSSKVTYFIKDIDPIPVAFDLGN